VDVAPASAKTISDPKETAITVHDVRSVTLSKPSARKLAWKLVTWDSWASSTVVGPSDGPLTLYLDVRNTAAVDFKIEIVWDPTGSALACQVEKPNGVTLRDGTVSRASQSSVRCAFTTKGFRTNKPIHWRVETAPRFALHDDKAPNSGWAIGIG
jgi:hypothetical protein